VPSAIKLIAGLGNPGQEYTQTRHNAGFWFVDLLARKHSLSFRAESRFQAEICRLRSNGVDCWVCKPMTFMNSSGHAIRAVVNFYRIPVEQIMIVHDEIDLDAGVVRFKQGGGHGGHNGLRDIIEQLDSNAFNRLRIGVGHPGDKDLVTPHLLGSSNADDCTIIMESITAALDVMPEVFNGEFMKAMNKLHKKQSQVTSEKSKVNHEKDKS
jgi:peptidyl-tRNA hydrolase, PTH1 family